MQEVVTQTYGIPDISGELLVNGCPVRIVAFLSHDFFRGGRPGLLKQRQSLKNIRNFLYCSRGSAIFVLTTRRD